MRLTLRTLLAYLDDTLEPHETREIGRKIQESPVASALVSRVREVIRKRRLGAPEIDGPAQGIDPNVVAQYLDNTLSPEQVAQVEAICLESDLVLAEVAACHQVLSSIQGEPVELTPRSRERFYALGPVSAEAQFQAPRVDAPKPVVATADRTHPSRAAVAAPVSESAGHFRDELVGKLKTPSWSQRVGPAAGAALVIAALILVLVLDRDLFRGMVKPASRNAASENAVAKVDSAVAQTPTPDSNTKAEQAAPQMAANDTKTTGLANLDPAPPPDQPEPGKSSPQKETDVADAASVLPKPATPVITGPQPASPASTVPTPAPPMPMVAVPVRSTEVEGVLLRFQPTDGHWYLQQRRSDLHAGEMFACPEPYEATFEWDQGLLKTTLLGETSVQILPSTEQRRYPLLVRRGRVLFQPGPAVKGPTVVSLTIGGTTQDVTLSTAGTTIGVEVRIEAPKGYPAADFPNPYRATLFVVSGEAKLADGPPLAAKQFARLAGPDTASSAIASSSWPAWLDPARRAPLPTTKLLGAKFEAQFDPKLAVGLSIPALLRDSHANLAELAAKCLSLIESSPDMVQALSQLDHKEARVAAAEGLRSWLALDPSHGMLLLRELDTHFPTEQAQAVERLLWGYTREQAQDKLTSQELVNCLRDNHLVVRELAFQQLFQLTGRRNNFVPNGTASQREIGVQQWENQLKRDGALLKPDE